MNPASFRAAVSAAASVLLAVPAGRAATLELTSPLEFQVVQRTNETTGTIPVRGRLAGAADGFEARMARGAKAGSWTRLAVARDGDRFEAGFAAPSGGWRRLEVRALAGGAVVAEATVTNVGVGEVFVVAGQSNSANHGEERQRPRTGRVATFDGRAWRPADDPQPGAGGGGGSFMPPFGDAIVGRLNVPVGIVACGQGGTSVREWLPRGAEFPNPPTVMAHVSRAPSGAWTCDGALFDNLVARMRPLGTNGFRSVLWHQGESDANQADPTRTLEGGLYREYLRRVIEESSRGIGWRPPWFVAQATYHVPGDEASPDIRAAQASLWREGVALEGPDTDALKGPLRDGGGKGVHFSGEGLRAHGAAWAAKVAPWIAAQGR